MLAALTGWAPSHCECAWCRLAMSHAAPPLTLPSLFPARPLAPCPRLIMGLILLVVLGIIAIIVLNILKAQGVSLPGVRPLCGGGGGTQLPSRSLSAAIGRSDDGLLPPLHAQPYPIALTLCCLCGPMLAAEPAAAAVGAA